MAIPTPIGFNFTGIKDFNLSINIPSKASELIPAITQNANTATGHYFGYVILAAVWVILFWVLNDKSPFAEFKYSSARSAFIGFGVCSVLGLSMLEANFITNFKAVAMFIVLYIATFIFILAYENKE